MDEISDEQLLERFGESGDVTLLDTLVSRNIGKIREAVYGMLLNHEDADDVTQDVFIKAFDKLHGFDERRLDGSAPRAGTRCGLLKSFQRLEKDARGSSKAWMMAGGGNDKRCRYSTKSKSVSVRPLDARFSVK